MEKGSALSPELLVQSLEKALAWATECELATIEYYRGLKHPPKNELERHEFIAKKLVMQCKVLGVKPIDMEGFGCGRLKECMEETS
jgi:hypothetical protein